MRKPRQFDHKSIYIDQKKEEREARERRIKRELGMDDDLTDYKPQIKGTFVEGTRHLKKSQGRGDDVRTRASKSMWLLLIIAILIILFWVLFIR